MKEQLNKPKGFGEILDVTFRLVKNRFSDFFLIFLILLGPVYLIQALIQLLSGTSFFRETGSGDVWYEQFMSTFEEAPPAAGAGGSFVLSIVEIAGLLLIPVAQAAILLAINQMKNKEEYTVGSALRQAFSKFWPIVGSSLLFGVIMVGLIFVPMMMIFIGGFIGATADLLTGILVGIFLFLGILIAAGLVATRWSFYLGSVVLEGDAPGLARSWELTRNRMWKLFGLYVVLSLINAAISTAMEALFGIFLGNSVLFSILLSLVTLVTTLIFAVGYAVIFLDVKTRHSADDVKEMLQEYNHDPK